MRIIRLVGLMLVAVVARSFAVVSSASAFSSNPLFSPASGQSVTSLGLGNATLVAAGNTIVCTAHQTVSGTVSNSLLIGNVVIHYLGCSATVTTTGTTGCSVKSIGAPGENLILTKTLHGILGLLLPSNETGILFLPVAGREFVTFAKSEKEGKECTKESEVEGSVAALVSPVGQLTLTGTLTTLAVAKAAIDLTHGLGPATAKLTAFGETGTQAQTDDVTFGIDTEVT
jgi:hypothetical protein